MRVLMFGWEFPPHISGGLGTACLGLTQSLVREKVALTFVVPKLFGNEPCDRMKLVSASDITLPLESGTLPVSRKPASPVLRTYTKTTAPQVRTEKKTSTYATIEVESALVPYSEPSFKSSSWTVENWNYVFEPGTTTTVTETIDTDPETESVPVGYTYKFAGGYGSLLMQEVDQYASVASQLASSNLHDIIHAHDWMTYRAGIAAKKVSGKPLVIHVHATEYDRSGQCAGPVYQIECEGMREADKIVAVSQWTKDILVSRYGIDSEKIVVVHNGIVTAEAKQEDTEKTIGSQVVTFLGRVTHQKGPGYFVEAARKVSKRFPDAHFIVAGSGDLLPQTIERVAQLRMSQKFHFTGFLTQQWISKIWSMSNVYVMPSVSEPFGITPLEAIQAGVPVIISNQSGVAEVMPHALKVDFWDTEALAESICSVLAYSSLSSMLRQKGGKEIKELSWTKAAQKLKSIYEEIVA